MIKVSMARAVDIGWETGFNDRSHTYRYAEDLVFGITIDRFPNTSRKEVMKNRKNQAGFIMIGAIPLLFVCAFWLYYHGF